MQCLQNRVVVVACGVGRDSTGMLVGLHERQVRPEAILFADIGGEKQATYASSRTCKPGSPASIFRR